VELFLNRKDKLLVLVIAAFLLIVTSAGLLLGDSVSPFITVLSASAVAVVVLEVFRRLLCVVNTEHKLIELSQFQTYRQTESLLSVLFSLKPDLPLPETRDWATSPDLLKWLLVEILIRKPELVVEASSGVSTVLIAYALKRLGSGKLISLEHSERYADSTRRFISLHGLDDITTVLHAPLQEYQLKKGSWLWYDMSGMKLDRKIDLLVIDGPPEGIQDLSRYPAIPLLYSSLSHEAIIVMDDGRRDGEKRITAMWEEEFDCLSSEYLDMEKGAFFLQMNRRQMKPTAADMQDQNTGG